MDHLHFKCSNPRFGICSAKHAELERQSPSPPVTWHSGFSPLARSSWVSTSAVGFSLSAEPTWFMKTPPEFLEPTLTFNGEDKRHFSPICWDSVWHYTGNKCDLDLVPRSTLGRLPVPLPEAASVTSVLLELVRALLLPVSPITAHCLISWSQILALIFLMLTGYSLRLNSQGTLPCNHRSSPRPLHLPDPDLKHPGAVQFPCSPIRILWPLPSTVRHLPTPHRRLTENPRVAPPAAPLSLARSLPVKQWLKIFLSFSRFSSLTPFSVSFMDKYKALQGNENIQVSGKRSEQQSSRSGHPGEAAVGTGFTPPGGYWASSPLYPR